MVTASWPAVHFRPVARPYGDPVEIITAPVPAQSPFIPADAKIVVGAVAPASPDPIPIVLLPGFEYRMREWRHPSTHEIHWRLERRKSAQHGEDDESPHRSPNARAATTAGRIERSPLYGRPTAEFSSAPVKTARCARRAAVRVPHSPALAEGRSSPSTNVCTTLANVWRCRYATCRTVPGFERL